ncbi:ferritin-like domain-containing protein [Kushneria phosphatilytica]|uniref:Ferritin-like domain-containing protein n=1 Tax=Kushneria phosphatilytica TaxID=657387 RepID=A0A1S1NTS1_9GAMM|nr:ferritin-like domain-containing protein [Kushneria phosphatilytica]OHV12954.1 hypothetical protein BH688_02830 [Kushneria phosphatilytica]QEL10822.1 ferritin-like domain-containing protein [Kushneria phosphatilytica]
MTRAEERLLQWLRDAHAMEEQAEQMLRGQASRIEHYPELHKRIEQHIDETCDQAAQIKGCIERLGGTTSGFKDMGGKLAAMGQALGGSMASDEVVKGGQASYAFEHFEISTYKALIAAAEAVDDQETRRICEGILEQEKAMAGWLEEQLPAITRQYLERDASDEQTAKR